MLMVVIVACAMALRRVREGMEVCPVYVEGGLLTPADIAAIASPQKSLEEDRAAGISINLKVKRSMPSGAALNTKSAVTRLF